MPFDDYYYPKSKYSSVEFCAVQILAMMRPDYELILSHEDGEYLPHFQNYQTYFNKYSDINHSHVNLENFVCIHNVITYNSYRTVFITMFETISSILNSQNVRIWWNYKPCNIRQSNNRTDNFHVFTIAHTNTWTKSHISSEGSLQSPEHMNERTNEWCKLRIWINVKWLL